MPRQPHPPPRPRPAPPGFPVAAQEEGPGGGDSELARAYRAAGGDASVTVVLCGEGVGDVRAVEPAAAVVARVAAEAAEAILAAGRLVVLRGPPPAAATAATAAGGGGAESGRPRG